MFCESESVIARPEILSRCPLSADEITGLLAAFLNRFIRCSNRAGSGSLPVIKSEIRRSLAKPIASLTSSLSLCPVSCP
ncbi:MAG: hypothetical protein HC824_01290 [Synechococcales cyanobacterium RM1_1_8]|nr:hypothetical protein [Synechococcales cyanobacterium RM1_1_8]